MSKNHQNAAVATPSVPKSADSELEAMRAELASVRDGLVCMALLVMPHHLRNFCECRKLACVSVRATKAGVYDVQAFQLCDDCTLPDGWREVGRVSLGPAERETVRIANKLGCFSPA